VLLTETGAGFQHSKVAALAHLIVLRGCGRGFQNGIQNELAEFQAGVTEEKARWRNFPNSMRTNFSSGLAFIELKAGDSGNEVQARALFERQSHCRKGRLP
jgi:hypothetical protein